MAAQFQFNTTMRCVKRTEMGVSKDESSCAHVWRPAMVENKCLAGGGNSEIGPASGSL